MVSPAQGSIILVNLFKPLSDIASRQHLRSANSHQLYVQRYRRTMFGRRAFSVAGPTAWNTLRDNLRDPALPVTTTYFQSRTENSAALILLAYQRIRGSATMR